MSQPGSGASSLRIAIFGTGALGSLLAARLAHANAGEVVVWGTWQDALDTIADQGIVVETAGDQLTVPVCARHRNRLLTHGEDTSEAAALDAGARPFDLVLVLVKSWQTTGVAEFVARAVSRQGLVVSLQNGLDNREALGRHVDASQLAAGVTAVGARLLAPGRVCPGGDGGTVLAPPPGTPIGGARLAHAARAFRHAGLTVQTVADLGPAMWSKLAVNCAINPLTALARVANGALVETAARRNLMTAVAHEVGRVALAQGVELDHDPATRALEVAAATATNHNSMLQDVLAGRRTEIDALCGAVVERADAVGIEVPLNRMLAKRVHALDASRGTPRKTDADLETLADLERLVSAHFPQTVAR